jgi:ABC-type multidrug transport system ATPase subunit
LSTGCGKTTFLKAISGQLNTSGCEMEGSLTYNGDRTDSKKFIPQKVVNFVSELEVHNALMTVYETFVFAFKAATGGHHGYGKSKDAVSAEVLNLNDKSMNKVKDIMTVLGLNSCKDTYVGNDMIRGVSGGQKRRVTVGEMMLLPGEIKVMDAISNGLDAATTFDIVHAMKTFVSTMKATGVVSLLQPSPEVFNQFDDLILLSQGQIIYHGPVEDVLEYFESIGYVCPSNVDVADFLQEVPMPEGQKYLKSSTEVVDGSEVLGGATTHVVGTAQLAAAWNASSLCKDMMADVETLMTEKHPAWLPHHTEKYASSFMFYLNLLLEREVMVLKRDLSFIRSRLMQVTIVGIIVSTLFTNLDPSDTQTMGGFLFFASLQCSLSGMSLIPVVFAQKAVYYKQYQASFFPSLSFVLSQSFVLLPLQILEAILFSLITYFSVGMSLDDGGGQFFLFVLTILLFGISVSQIFRLVASLTAEPTSAQPICGVILVVMVLFSGYIIPKNGISDGWIWFYWINPLAYALRGITVNEFLGSDYDTLVCADYPACSQQLRFGDIVLESRGNPTDQAEVYYGIIYVIGVYLLGLLGTTLALVFVVVEPQPTPPEYEDFSGKIDVSPSEVDGNEVVVVNAETSGDENESSLQSSIIPFEPVSFSFKNVWYTVKLKGGEELDLLRGVDGCFEPGTVTALMGSSGAGKTTLLDVLAGRKNTGTVTGLLSVNGAPKDEKAFRKVMAYVEQFDSLCPTDTAREAIEFSAALRLPAETDVESRMAWVESIIDMLELGPIENRVVGKGKSGFSFEQRKRLSIAVELAANPSILFLDEPTSGLDSRAAQVAIRSIKRVAASGRSVVCTIHQPSVFIFNSFESLLLLKRGGQTVFYGDLGEDCNQLISYFESAPGVSPCGRHNPATWMLDVIGAGTGVTSDSNVDFHHFYKNSDLCRLNTTKVDALCSVRENDGTSTPDGNGRIADYDDSRPSTGTQFLLLLKRGYSSYWRNPNYNLVRMIISVIIALLFASAYANYKYTTDVDTISLAAVIYITSLFIG